MRKLKLKSDKSGTIAIEMAFILAIFIFLIFNIIEYGTLFYLSSRVESAANKAARVGMTGNLYGAKDREELIQKNVVENLKNVTFNFDPNRLSVRVAALDNYSIPGIDATAANNFGTGGQFSLYNITYKWHLITPILMYTLGDENGEYNISARVIVKNEEF
jgi:Flp pilus assembly protein TadG